MKKAKHITIMACIATILLNACNDDFVPNRNTHNSDVVGFTLNCAYNDSTQARSNEKQPFCGVLAMTNGENSQDSLYLHTNVTDMSAPMIQEKANSRGIPVKKDNFGDKFTVYAYTHVDNNARIYMDGIEVTKGNNDVWLPETNFYWTENNLDFFAYHNIENYEPVFHNISYVNEAKKEAKFSYTVPKSTDGNTDAEAQPDLLMAYANCGKGDSDGIANLTFTHALSAVKFELDIPMNGKIKTVSIEGIKGSGDCVFNGEYSWTPTGDNVTYTQSFERNITTSEVEGDMTIALTDEKISATFMLIPQVLSSSAKVTVVMEDSDNGVEHTFSGIIGDGSAEWIAGKTYTYIISRDAIIWDYVFEVTPSINFLLTDDTNKSYSVKSYKQTASASQTIPLKWAVTNFADIPQIVDEKGDAKDNGTAVNSTTAPAWFSAFTTGGTGNVAENVITIVPQKIKSNYAGDITMQNEELKGSEEQPWDLSTHRHDKSIRPRCTANCYVVHSAGTYMLPLVYGNAIYNGADNPSAYTYQSTGAETASQYVVGNNNISGRTTRYNFQDHVIKSDVNTADGANDGITQPYISKKDGGKYDVADAVMLWQDAYNIVKQGSVGLTTTEDGKQALKFTLNKDFMQQANIVLAVRDASGTILWSWHIWVYEHNVNSYYVLANYQAKLGQAGTKAYTESFKFSTGNLGHCMAKKLEIPAGKAEVTFTQYELDGTTPVSATPKMTVTLQGMNFEETVGNNTYYQWGRKDPMIGVQNRTDNLKTYYTDPTILPNVDTDPSLSNDTRKYGYKVIEERATIARTIQNPTVFFSEGNKKTSNYTYAGRRCDDWVIGPGRRDDSQSTGREVGYFNLWNNYDYIHTNSCYNVPTKNLETDEYNEKIDNNNTKVIKTVYDPCPIGFKMPSAAAFRSISTYGGRGTWHPTSDDSDVYSVATSNNKKYHSYSIISLETLTQTGDKSWDKNFPNTDYTDDDVLSQESNGYHILSDQMKGFYPFIWVKNGSEYELKSNYKDYTEGNKFNGGFQSFTEGNITTNRYFINAIGASFSTGGDNTRMSIEATGQRHYGGLYSTNIIGVSNLSPKNVYLWTGDVFTNTNTTTYGNVAISLLLQQDASYPQNVDGTGNFYVDSQFSAAKAMARPIRPMWDEDFNDALR